MNGIIIEGLAGTGKSILINMLLHNDALLARYGCIKVYYEDQTLGELVTEIRDATMSNAQRCARFVNLLPGIVAGAGKDELIILERAHHSYYALMPDWALYESTDKQLQQAGFATVLLHMDETLIEERCFNRVENGAGFRQGLIEWYGSYQNAFAAFTSSQNNRRRALQLSALPYTIINTGSRQWQTYANTITGFVLQ